MSEKEDTQPGNSIGVNENASNQHIETNSAEEEIYDPKIEQIIEDNPKLGELIEEHPEIKHQLTIETTSYSGPLPHPQLLKQFDQVQKGFADRIISMAESDSKHIQEMQKAALDAKKLEVTLGQIFAFLIGIAALICGTTAAIYEQPIVGGLIGTGGVIGLVTAFILGRSKQKE